MVSEWPQKWPFTGASRGQGRGAGGGGRCAQGSKPLRDLRVLCRGNGSGAPVCAASQGPCEEGPHSRRGEQVTRKVPRARPVVAETVSRAPLLSASKERKRGLSECPLGWRGFVKG